MIDETVERIKQIISTKNLSETSFAKIIGANQKTINQQLKGERGLSTDTILKILSTFEEISSEWLMRGTGDMFRSVSNTPSAEIEALKAEINMLRGENRVLREQLGLPDRKETATLSA